MKNTDPAIGQCGEEENAAIVAARLRGEYVCQWCKWHFFSPDPDGDPFEYCGLASYIPYPDCFDKGEPE